MAAPPHSEPPGITDTAVRVIEAGQRVLLDRFDLARFDLTRLVALGARAAAAMAAATVLLSGAWFAIIAAIAVRLQADLALSLPASLLLVAAASALVGIGTIAVCLRRVSAFELTAISGPSSR